MKKKNLLTILSAIWIMLAGCEIFPYVLEPEFPLSPTLTATSAQPNPTQIPMTATLDPTTEPTITSTAFVPTPTTTIAVEVDLPIQTPTYNPQDGNPIYLPNFAHPESECEWLGVAGQVFDAQGFEVQDLIIIVGDNQKTEGQWSTQTGMAQAYGPGGYEIQISNVPQETHEMYWVQVLDQNGIQLSERIFFDTFNNCSLNLVLMNFIFNDSSSEKALPTPTL